MHSDECCENRRKWIEERNLYRAALGQIFKEAAYATPYDAADLLIAIGNQRKTLGSLPDAQ